MKSFEVIARGEVPPILRLCVNFSGPACKDLEVKSWTHFGDGTFAMTIRKRPRWKLRQITTEPRR